VLIVLFAISIEMLPVSHVTSDQLIERRIRSYYRTFN